MTDKPSRRLNRPALLSVPSAQTSEHMLTEAAYAIFKKSFGAPSTNMRKCVYCPAPEIRTTSHKNSRRILTTRKMLKAASILSIPVYATTQNRSRLGETCAELDLSNAIEHLDKTAFSMWIPPISRHFSSSTPSEIVLVGIETHICITQTTLDLLAAGHKVYILVDGVSSCNKEEISIALDRLRKEGAIVTTSESWIFECMGDASIPEFKAVAGLVKQSGGDTKDVLGTLVGKSKI
ncbi:hypothetical protein PZA11_007366 [Diplocarpon coronariae]|uniref:Isochorismatase domain-containing protein n=1 Tax=Diplocarpon coronariae TaxID=2795749 RepID=A0A218ZH81_9HELO|nr:isochorismatase domain-containing protein [Marssonina coronariae]